MDYLHELWRRVALRRGRKEDDMRAMIFCTQDNMHPYECGGRGKCPHCDERVVPGIHNPMRCAWCDSNYSEGTAAGGEQA